MGYSLPIEAAKSSSSLQVVIAEVEDASAKLLCHEAELQLLAERLDEQDGKLQRLSSAKPDNLAQQIQQLEKTQRTLENTVTVLTASVKDIQTSLKAKLQEIQKDHKALSQDLRLLRRSLLALTDGASLEAYTDLSEGPKNIHIVRPGETLSKIAEKYRIPVAELKKLNKLSSDVIYADQKLRLPENKK